MMIKPDEEALWPIWFAWKKKKQKERHKLTFFAISDIKIHSNQIHNFNAVLFFFFPVQLMTAMFPLMDYNSNKNNNDTFVSANSWRENVNFSNAYSKLKI